MEFVLDVLLDAVKDTLVLIPFLFVTYVVISLLELFAGDKAASAIQRAGHAGPAIGAVLGVIPQCGFSAVGAMLYADRFVTLGTLVAVILSTSDEMLPLLVAEHVDPAVLGRILLSKAAIGLVAGFAVDGVLHLLGRGELAEPESFEAEDSEGDDFDPSQYTCDCGCGEPLTRGQAVVWVLINSAYRTAQVVAFIFVVTLILGGLIEWVGEDAISAFLSSNAVLAMFCSALVGMVPNCAASVIVTQLYLDGALGLAPMMAGTLVAGGAGYLVLFRTNENARQNAAILGLLYAIGVVSGLVILGLGL